MAGVKSNYVDRFMRHVIQTLFYAPGKLILRKYNLILLTRRLVLTSMTLTMSMNVSLCLTLRMLFYLIVIKYV